MAAGSGRSGLRAFVTACRQQWLEWAATAVGQRSPLHLVLGNEASDLDSVACALVYAYHLTQQPRMATRLVLPLINVPVAELPLRTEVTHVLARLHISPSDLLSIHELEVPKLLAAGAEVSMSLVDHNRLAVHQECLAPCVVEAIDHHAEEAHLLPAIERTILPVGSCSTLIARACWETIEKDTAACELLLSPLLVDTVCLDTSAGRCHDLDRVWAASLAASTGLTPQEVFVRVNAAKSDVSHLSVAQLLRKDNKKVQVGRVRASLPVVGMPLAQLCQEGDAEDALTEFMQELRVDLLLVMTTTQTPTFARELALFTLPSLRRTAWFRRVVEQLQGLGLGLEPLHLGPQAPAWIAFSQQALQTSRKVLLPALGKVLETTPTQQHGRHKVRLVGLAGGIGCGKSTLATLLEKLGAVVINADAAAHQCYAPGTATHAALVAQFGASIVNPEKGGIIDRAELGKRVFADATQMRQLTAIVWPVVAETILARVAELEGTVATAAASPQVVVVEAAALVEAGWHLLCDDVVVVHASSTCVRERLLARGLNEDDIALRQRAQRDARGWATHTMENSGDRRALEAAVHMLWGKLNGVN